MGGGESKPLKRDASTTESKPWRAISELPTPTSWTRTVESTFREKCLRDLAEGKNLGTDLPKILMFGPSKHGKSSLVNSMLNATKKTKSFNQYVQPGNTESSFTKTLYSPLVFVDEQPLKFKLTDMPGIFQGMEEYAEDYLKAALRGHIKEDFIVPAGPLNKSAAYYIQKPGPFDQPCCVVLIMKAGTTLTQETKDRFRLVYDVAQTDRMKVALVLTHVDNLRGANDAVIKGKNVARMFHEMEVYKAVHSANNVSGIPISFIHPVVNYIEEVETTTEMNILHLYTLSKILDMARLEVTARLAINE